MSKVEKNNFDKFYHLQAMRCKTGHKTAQSQQNVIQLVSQPNGTMTAATDNLQYCINELTFLDAVKFSINSKIKFLYASKRYFEILLIVSFV